MLPPIRPRPSIASCIGINALGTPSMVSPVWYQSYGLAQRRNDLPGIAVLDVDAQGPPAVRLQDLEVAPCLRREEGPERVGRPRDRQILAAVAGDLEEQPGIRAALVKLTGGVQEARAEAHGASELRRVADGALHLLEALPELALRWKVELQSDVITGIGERQVRGDPPGRRGSDGAAERSGGLAQHLRVGRGREQRKALR